MATSEIAINLKQRITSFLILTSLYIINKFLKTDHELNSSINPIFLLLIDIIYLLLTSEEVKSINKEFSIFSQRNFFLEF